MTYEHTHRTPRQQNNKPPPEHHKPKHTKQYYRHAHHGTWLGSPRSSQAHGNFYCFVQFTPIIFSGVVDILPYYWKNKSGFIQCQN